MAALRFGTGAQFARVQQRLTRQTYRLQHALGPVAVAGEKRLNARLTRLEQLRKEQQEREKGEKP
jgi:hypothetical protein